MHFCPPFGKDYIFVKKKISLNWNLDITSLINKENGVKFVIRDISVYDQFFRNSFFNMLPSWIVNFYGYFKHVFINCRCEFFFTCLLSVWMQVFLLILNFVLLSLLLVITLRSELLTHLDYNLGFFLYLYNVNSSHLMYNWHIY